MHVPDRLRPRRGFTMTELLIVVAMIAVLAAILLPVTRGALRRAGAARARSIFQQQTANPAVIAAWNFEGTENDRAFNRATGGRVNPFHKSENLHLALEDDDDTAGVQRLPGRYPGPQSDLTAIRLNPDEAEEGDGAWAVGGWPKNFTADVLTVALWFRAPVRAPAAGQSQYLLWVGDQENFDSSAHFTFLLRLEYDADTGLEIAWEHAYDEIDDDGDYTRVVFEPDAVPADLAAGEDWHHLVVTKDAEAVRFYLDYADATVDPEEVDLPDQDGNTRPWRLSIQEVSGRDVGVIPASQDHPIPIPVTVDEMVLLNEVLTPLEIQGLYEQGRP